jgi:hypothetical protein
VGGFILRRAGVADLADDRIQKDHRPDRLQRSGLPFSDLFDDRIGDLGDQVRGNLNVVDLGQMVLNITDCHAVGVEADHDLVDAVHPPLTLADDPRLVGAVAVSRHLHVDAAGLGEQCLRRVAVAAVPRAQPRRVANLIAQVTG